VGSTPSDCLAALGDGDGAVQQALPQVQDDHLHDALLAHANRVET
jgi:hypothetical protein